MIPFAQLKEIVGNAEAQELIRLANKTTALESHFARSLEAAIAKMTDEILADSRKAGRLVIGDAVDFLPPLMRGVFDVSEESIRSTQKRERLPNRLAAPPPGVFSKSLKELRKWWDSYRKGKVPKRQAEQAKQLADEYLDRLRQTWAKHSTAFLTGSSFDNTEAERAIKRDAGITASRAKMIAATETTYYFNRTRREIFDQSGDVTHYLFVAIRDHRTTKWCKTRHRLVYAKGDPLLEKETPPIHWYCRSEMLPLTPKNPNHLRLIQDTTLARRNNSPEPLPPEWKQRA